MLDIVFASSWSSSDTVSAFSSSLLSLRTAWGGLASRWAWAGAGFVVALQDVVASVGGWFAIGASRLYTVGDRIRIGDTKGDVIDISILRTTVLEVGNWVSRDLHNGRLARIPNSLALKGPVFNYTKGFRFVWDEIKVTLTAQSNHRFARAVLLKIAQEKVADFMEHAQHTWKDIKDDYRIENPDLEPIVTLAVNGGSLEFTMSYIVDYAQRTLMKDRLFTKIADEIANSQGRLEWASSSASSSSGSQESSLGASLSR
jgi:small-conductance mechanosensitive channel